MIRCPRCNSKEIYAVAGGYGGYYYRCKKCGYAGALVVEYDDEGTPEEDREVQKEYRKEVQAYDRRRWSLLWIILILILIATLFLIRFP